MAAGTVVMTADGALPVDFLEPGDRIVTRSGMRALREIHLRRYSGPAVRIREGALGNGRPEQALVLPAHAPVLVRDWRAAALFGCKSVVMEVDRLVDGEFIVPTEAVSMRLFDLRFDHPEIVYAEGLEIACAAAETAVRVAAE
ncbi:MAG TPA: Hint domain-containing protein [Albidovulum sp.]|uniref:Hint domain-containing protein n=1 Tax=Albidovulum sp. TaxID=1872424 RepID=UPI002BB6245D|nr:Hint domain-containing protein [Albidovulum sp.]